MTLSQYELAWGMSTCGKSIEEFIFEMMESENSQLIEENQRLDKALKIALNYLEANSRATLTISEIKAALNSGK